jgi:predicted DNA-binding transcriptional regulator AlpA
MDKQNRTDGDQLLTLKEVLELVRHKKSWLYEKIEEELFPPGSKIGRRRFWRRSEVEEALRRLLVPALPPSGASTTQATDSGDENAPG